MKVRLIEMRNAYCAECGDLLYLDRLYPGGALLGHMKRMTSICSQAGKACRLPPLPHQELELVEVDIELLNSAPPYAGTAIVR